jgi:hypothetical protein
MKQKRVMAKKKKEMKSKPMGLIFDVLKKKKKFCCV